MTDNPNAGYYQSGKGSLSGFDEVNLPNSKPNLLSTGWSVDQLMRFLLNVDGANFPTPQALQAIVDRINEHVGDYDNPHRTTLDQIISNFTRDVLGSITPGTIPDTSPFFAYSASLPLPIETVVPVTYSNSNLYRKTSGGKLVDSSTETHFFGDDSISGKAGIPLFSSLINIVLESWATDPDTKISTTLIESTDDSREYPFPFYDVSETPVTSLFGIDIPMNQDLQALYTTNFFVYPSTVGGSIKIYQPGDTANYLVLNLTTGELTTVGTSIFGISNIFSDGVIRVSLTFTSLLPTADDKLRVVHMNIGDSDATPRAGENGRYLFSIGSPQTTTSPINQPTMVDISQESSTTPLTVDMSRIGAPATMSSIIVSMTIDLYPTDPSAIVQDGTIFTFGDLVISRDQTNIRVSVGGTTYFIADILEGTNKLTLSYSPSMLIFKDLSNNRNFISGTFPSLSTSNVSFGPFGGYLRDFAMYPQKDISQVVEHLNNG